MRFTKLMGAAVVVVGLAVALNALAFKTASVTNAASFTVSATQSAALAIEAAAPAGTGFTTNGLATGYLTLSIDDQMQPNSIYKFANVFQITNKAANTTTSITGINYTAAVDPNVVVKLYKAGTPQELTNETLAAAASVAVDMEIEVKAGAALATKNFNIVISGNQ